jgi:hypothetical protein
MQAPLVNPMSSTVLPRLVVSVGAVVGLHLARQRRAQQVSRAPTSAGARRASVDTARPAAAVAAAAAASLPLWQSSAAPLTALLTLWSPANLLRAVSAAAASASVCWSRVAVGAVATWSAVSTQLVEAAAQVCCGVLLARTCCVRAGHQHTPPLLARATTSTVCCRDCCAAPHSLPTHARPCPPRHASTKPACASLLARGPR